MFFVKYIEIAVKITPDLKKCVIIFATIFSPRAGKVDSTEYEKEIRDGDSIGVLA